MGRIGRVIKSYIDKLSGSSTDAQFASVEEFANDQRTVQIFGPCNEDFAPPENCKTINIPLGRGRGFLVSAAYHNQQIVPVAVHGERRLYSTNQAGDTVMTEVFLKQDGTILIKNDNASVTIAPDGAIDIVSAVSIEETEPSKTENIGTKEVIATTFITETAPEKTETITTKTENVTTSIENVTTKTIIGTQIALGGIWAAVRSLVDERFFVLFNAHVHSGVTAGAVNSGPPTTTGDVVNHGTILTKAL